MKFNCGDTVEILSPKGVKGHKGTIVQLHPEPFDFDYRVDVDDPEYHYGLFFYEKELRAIRSHT